MHTQTQHPIHPQARTTRPLLLVGRPDTTLVRQAASEAVLATAEWGARSEALHTAVMRSSLFFPDRRLLQFDCGKLQVGALGGCWVAAWLHVDFALGPCCCRQF